MDLNSTNFPASVHRAALLISPCLAGLMLACCDAEKPGAIPETPVPSEWRTKEWPMSRGGKELQGRVHDRVPRCLRQKDGSLVWKHDTKDYVNSSPAILEDCLFAFGACDALIHVVQLRDGIAANQVDSDAQIIRSLAVWDAMVYGVNHANQLIAADVKADKPTWLYENEDGLFLTIPGVEEERVYVGGRDRQLHAVDCLSGKPRWKFKAGGRVESSPLVFDDAVVFGSGDGRLYAVDKHDGGEIWILNFEGYDPLPSKSGSPIIGYLVRMCRENGLEVMVSTFIHLRNSLMHPDARLPLAGASTEEHQALIDAVKQRLVVAGLAEHVSWQTNISRAEKAAMLNSLTLFSVPATYPEAFGLYLIEATASGAPVVQPESASFPEIVEKSGVGVLVPPGDPVALARAWHELLQQPEQLRVMTKRCCEAAEKFFDVRVMWDKFMQIIQQIL